MHEPGSHAKCYARIFWELDTLGRTLASSTRVFAQEDRLVPASTNGTIARPLGKPRACAQHKTVLPARGRLHVVSPPPPPALSGRTEDESNRLQLINDTVSLVAFLFSFPL